MPTITAARRWDPPLHGPYRVKRVIDGDTICLLMNGRPEAVRLIGIDAPETVHPDRT